jgi:DNA (cytosine-5)-methyltransferase 1
VSTLVQPREKKQPSAARALKTVGLFAGIGGLELGLARAGHQTFALCEIDPAAREVLDKRFAGIEVIPDVTEYHQLPRETQLVTAGFPCQDLSQAGRTRGIAGARSSLIGEVFRLLEASAVEWVLLENVPFMLHLARGKALEVILDALEELDYKWAYRVVNSRSFGLPQRRERVYFLASRTEDPRTVLFADDVGDQPEPTWTESVAAGFYWTEGRGGLGWAVDAVPTLKNGSTIGIASPPAILLPDGDIVKPGIRDAERMQGFEPDWTLPAEAVGRPSLRWRLVGNAVTVDVAEWIGQRLVMPGEYSDAFDEPLAAKSTWPRAAYNVGNGRFVGNASAWPMARRGAHLHEFLEQDGLTSLSLKAVSGFLARYEQGSLRKSHRFLAALRAHKARMERATS